MDSTVSFASRVLLRPRLSRATLAWTALALFGIYAGLKATMAVYGPNADTSHSLLMWYGIKHSGFGWVKQWVFTPDNWLLSLVPIAAAVFSIFGPTFAATILLGWAFFIGSALAAAGIACASGAKKAALPIAAVLLNLGIYAHDRGCASFSTSHNVTNLFGLTAVLCSICWLNGGNLLFLPALFVLMVAGSVSDPWMLVAFDGPIIVACLVLAVLPKARTPRHRSVLLAAFAASAILLTKTKLLGLFAFLPGFSPPIATWPMINGNALSAFDAVGGLLNVVPRGGDYLFIPAFVSLALLATCYLLVVANLARARSRPDDDRLFIYIVAGLSVLGTIGALSLMSTPTNIGSARFLINTLYFAIIPLGILAGSHWGRLSVSTRVVCGVAAGAFLLASSLSTAHYWKQPKMAFKDTGVEELVHYLDANHLTYGYGPYWGSEANAVTIATHERIRLRPATFDPVGGIAQMGGRPQTSADWYRADDAPAATRQWFVIVQADGEECPDTQVCVMGLTRQFGNPARTLYHGPQTILVWHHPLIGYRPPPIPVAIGQTLTFNASGVGIGSVEWSTPVGDGPYMIVVRAPVHLRLAAKPSGDLSLTVTGYAFLAGTLTAQTVEVSVNGQPVGSMHFTAQDNRGSRTFRIPASTIGADGRMDIEFHVLHPKSPQELGISADTRKLGLLLQSMTLASAVPGS